MVLISRAVAVKRMDPLKFATSFKRISIQAEFHAAARRRGARTDTRRYRNIQFQNDVLTAARERGLFAPARCRFSETRAFRTLTDEPNDAWKAFFAAAERARCGASCAPLAALHLGGPASPALHRFVEHHGGRLFFDEGSNVDVAWLLRDAPPVDAIYARDADAALIAACVRRAASASTAWLVAVDREGASTLSALGCDELGASGDVAAWRCPQLG